MCQRLYLWWIEQVAPDGYPSQQTPSGVQKNRGWRENLCTVIFCAKPATTQRQGHRTSGEWPAHFRQEGQETAGVRRYTVMDKNHL